MSAPVHPFLDWPYPIPFAHRGGASDAPENTMPAFEYAIDLGYRYIETDVQVTSDGVLVAFHDFNLKRTCGIDKRISEMSWSELSTARVDGKAAIPTLDEMLHAWPEARVNIDCKTDLAVDALVNCLQQHAALDRVCVGAFNDRRLQKLRAALGVGLCTSLGPRGVSSLLFGRMRATAAMAAQVPVRQGPLTVISPRFMTRANRLGLQVHAWTIDDTTEMHRLLDLGVHGIMTDKLAVLRDVLRGRGMWA